AAPSSGAAAAPSTPPPPAPPSVYRSATSTALRLLLSVSRSQMARQQATANNRSFLSLALPRRNSNIGCGLVLFCHSASVIASPSATPAACSSAATAPWIDLVAGTPAAEGSARNLQSRQCCLEVLYSRVRDLGAGEDQDPQSLERFQFFQPCVRDLGVGQDQGPQVRKLCEFLYPLVRDLGVSEVQRLQAPEFLQLFQPCVRDLGEAE